MDRSDELQQDDAQKSTPEGAFETCDFQVEDVPALAQLFRDAVSVSGISGYTAEQCAAWAKSADDEAAFGASLSEGWVRLAVDDDGIVGFAQINMPGHIAMLYTAPRAARRGVGTLLLDDMLALGDAMGADALTVEASIVARPLFQHFGFEDIGIEEVERNGMRFKRHRMRRPMKRPRH
jgi:putative acetyltransferase